MHANLQRLINPSTRVVFGFHSEHYRVVWFTIAGYVTVRRCLLKEEEKALKSDDVDILIACSEQNWGITHFIHLLIIRGLSNFLKTSIY